MLSQRDVAQWAQVAPWSNIEQVEQDLLITRVVHAIFTDPVLSTQVAMRGGTVLHKVHLAPAARYSEDVDLVAVGNGSADSLMRALEQVVKPVMGTGPSRDFFADVRLAFRNVASKSEIGRQTYEFVPVGSTIKTGELKVEINMTERQPVFDLVTLPVTVPFPEGATTINIVSFDVNEMLGTKMRALLQREQGRDLFDLAHAWTTCTTPGHPHRIDGPRVVQAFQEYMRREETEMTRDEFDAKLTRKLALNRFRADLRDVLADHVVYDVDAAAQIVRDHYLVHLP